MRIRRLPLLLVNQIAAGEVIERSASVVKELVENALDAGATRVDIAVEGGGADLVRVGDDGAGIVGDELPLAVAAHATSKLREASDLEGVATLGFRGEALASVGSVSRLRIASRPTVDGRLEEAGGVLEMSGDEVSEVRPVAMAAGTVVEVRDLFFNTPARRKFLRTAATEFGHVHEAVQRIALTHPHVAFSLSHNDRSVLDMAAEGGEEGWRRRAVAVLGSGGAGELDEGLLAFEGPGVGGLPGWSVRGLAGQPGIARSNGKGMHLCVNGRWVRDRNLQHAVKEAYRGLMPGDRFPLAAVFVAVPPREVDVNVHPAKAEVRFRDPSRVHGLVHAAVRQRLLRADLTPSVGGRGEGAGGRWGGPDASLEDSLSVGVGGGGGREGGVNSSAFVDYFRRMDPTQKGFVFQEVKRALEEEGGGVPDASLEDSLSVGVKNLKSQIILQVHDSYVVTQDDQGLLIVDQHALHERVMFEELRRRILGDGEGDGRALESQRLLMPVTLEAGASRQALLEELGPLLARLGIEAESFGKERVAIHAFPSLMFDRGVEPAGLLGELLDAAESGDLDAAQLGRDGGQIEEAALHRVLDMMACKAAVKAGDHLGPEELAALLEQRERVERSSSCPHGRPTTLRLSLKDLAKQFGRT